jgi:hypothetical protein
MQISFEQCCHKNEVSILHYVLIKSMICIAQTVQDGPNHSAFDLYSGDQLFESVLGHPLQSLRFFVVFCSLSL